MALADTGREAPPGFYEARFDGTAVATRAQLMKVAEFLEPHIAIGRQMGDLQIVLGEVLNNIAEHALAQIDTDKTVALRIVVNDNATQVETMDHGCALPPRLLKTVPPPHLNVERADLPEGGFGWFMVHELSRSLDYKRDGSTNILRFEVPHS